MNAQDSNALSTGRGKPWLLPQNRRLRHLEGITIRNVALFQDQRTSKVVGKAVDEDSLARAQKSPAKLLAQREHAEKALAHSRSAGDLRQLRRRSHSGYELSEADHALKRPNLPKLRRRSTMDWTGAGPIVRQKRLEDVADAYLVDSFFAIHLIDEDDPIYVSERGTRARNPSFQCFDLRAYGPSVTRSSTLFLKLFAKPSRARNFQFILELKIHLASLQYVGKSLDSSNQPFPDNCVLFHLVDGIYIASDNAVRTGGSSDRVHQMPQPRAASTVQEQPSSSYDALMRLSTLDVCIQDALATREDLMTQMDVLLDRHRSDMEKVQQVAEYQESASRATSAVVALQKRLESSRRRYEQLRTDLKSRRQQIFDGRAVQRQAQQSMLSEQEALVKRRGEAQAVRDDATGQRRRCCEELQNIFPIEPVAGKSLAFTIRGLNLQHSDFEDAKDTELAAALGHVAQVVQLLSSYLTIPLPYSISSRGSTSLIDDHLSDMAEQNRSYPLYMKSAIRFRFEYGVFLLNKDIEILAGSLGLKILDIRQTLPNLKYLLYVATAGKGELPLRKAGGIRGLLRQTAGGSGATTPTLSVTGSDDGSDGVFKNRGLEARADRNDRRDDHRAKADVDVLAHKHLRKGYRPVDHRPSRIN